MGLGLTGRSRTRASHCPLARGVAGADLEFVGFVDRRCASSHHAFKLGFSGLPVRHDLAQELEECWAMIGLPDVAELMSDDIVDGIGGRFDQACIEHETPGRRHRSPSMA